MFGLKKDTKIHFIGIGGIGMSGIAEILLNMGYSVSGSDASDSLNTKRLRELGATVNIGHRASNVGNANIVVYSSAIREVNEEYLEAKKKGLPIIKRAEMLAELMRLKYGLAVAGTHGKTTTTSFLATILHECGMDPTHIIGGIVQNLGGHARLGSEKFLVAEADESDGSFLYLNPVMSVITNIDNDHLDYYKTEEKILEAFKEFINRHPFYGKVAINGHDKNIKKLIPDLKRPYVSFGIEGKALSHDKVDVMALNPVYYPTEAEFDLNYFGIKIPGFKISIPGEHNILNALGAIVLAKELGLSFDEIKKGIVKFKGVGRRLEKLYEDDFRLIIDDYGHHPTEISVTIQALKKSYPQHELIVFFEPHRYTRTRDCWDQFLNCFNSAEKVYLTPIYPASEDAIENITSENLVRDINRLHPMLTELMEDLSEMKKVWGPNDKKRVYLTLGAGAIGKKVRELIKEL